jgi:uncharacterized repeat protein (TIGR02543 family)
MNVKAACPAVFFLCAVLLTLAGCQDVFQSSAALRVSEGKNAGASVASIPHYTVTFDAAGGSVSPDPVTVKPGSSLDSLPDAAKDGYAFRGWYTGQDGGGEEFTAYTPVTENMTVYAKWAIQYTVTFDAGEGGQETRTAVVGESVGASNIPPDPVKTGYIFDGWYTVQNGGGVPFTASTTVTANITVYARWTPTEHTVTFNADGGSPETQKRTGHYGSPLNTLSEPTRTGHTFGGWFTDRNGGGTQFTDSTLVTAEIRVYAKWINTLKRNSGEYQQPKQEP